MKLLSDDYEQGDKVIHNEKILYEFVHTLIISFILYSQNQVIFPISSLYCVLVTLYGGRLAIIMLIFARMRALGKS